MSNQPAQYHHEEAYMALMKGLTKLDLCGPYVPCKLVLTGDNAFPLAMNGQGQVLMAASLYGRGRIVVLGHEGYLTTFPDLVENALTWLRGDVTKTFSVGVQKNVKAVADNLSKSSFQAKVVEAFSDNLEVGVYVTDAYSVGENPKQLVAFLKAGGGVLIAGHAIDWYGSHPKENTLLQFQGNKVSGVAGIYFTENKGEVQCLPVYPKIPSSWMAVVLGKDFEDDLEFLLEGVSEFDLQGGAVFSEVLVHGPLAFPIGTTEDGRAFLAGAYYGEGRVIVISHEGYLGKEAMAPFLINAIHWLDEGRQGVVGVVPDHALKVLSKSGLQCKKTNFREDLSVFVCTTYSEDHLEEIQDFVAEGGGLLIGGHAWYWAYTHTEQNPLTDFAGNKILNKMGLSVLPATIDGANIYKAPVPNEVIKKSYHFRHLLHRFAGHVTEGKELEKQEEDCLKQLGRDCSTYLTLKAHGCSPYTQILSTLTDIIMKLGLPQVSESNPVKTPKDHLLLRLVTEVYKCCPDPDALLPYLINIDPSTPVVYNHRIDINVSTAGWHEWISTGLYLPPGMKTYVAIPAEMVNKGWKIQLGCQTDKLNHAELKRAPDVSEHFPITAEMIQISNLWGGLIYLVAPHNTQVEGLQVTVQMAQPVPYYKSGVTTAADWSLLRTAPSPWAELEFENIILTVPSDAIRDLEHPDELATHWDVIMRAIAELAAIPHKFPRKERIVADVQISHGWMHAGYPIMGHKSTAFDLVNTDHVKKHGLWGPIHELGHNQQRGCWEFPSHTTECTCNLWSVYVHEEALGMNREKAHEAITPENRKERTKEFVQKGRPLSSWHMWLALETYLQLQEKFGWDAFKKVFAAYHKMNNFPGDNKGKMNLYAETFSKTVEMNLTGFFKAWSWPIEKATEEKLSNLPPWKDHPMVQYD